MDDKTLEDEKTANVTELEPIPGPLLQPEKNVAATLAEATALTSFAQAFAGIDDWPQETVMGIRLELVNPTHCIGLLDERHQSKKRNNPTILLNLNHVRHAVEWLEKNVPQGPDPTVMIESLGPNKPLIMGFYGGRFKLLIAPRVEG